MPYIRQVRRDAMEGQLKRLGNIIVTAGELNYAITHLVKTWTQYWVASYTTLATVTGVLDNVKNEFYRRVIVPFEEEKLAEHGDVYIAPQE